LLISTTPAVLLLELPLLLLLLLSLHSGWQPPVQQLEHLVCKLGKGRALEGGLHYLGETGGRWEAAAQDKQEEER
jgi:hypothetical protein